MGFQVTDVQKALAGADYPMDGDGLARLAERNGAGSDLVNRLRQLPKVDGPNTVMARMKDDLGPS